MKVEGKPVICFTGDLKFTDTPQKFIIFIFSENKEFQESFYRACQVPSFWLPIYGTV